jgi:hypothetical protein
VQKASYSENETATTGKKNAFPEWSPPEMEMQRKARAAVGAIRTFPDLEKRLIETLGFGPAAIMMHQLVGY